ncbi:MAG: hypothetical protein ABJB73_11445 [Candidatus Nitrosocosmicus sp.]
MDYFKVKFFTKYIYIVFANVKYRMKRGVFIIIGIILLIIGTAGGLFTGYIVVNSAAQVTDFEPTKAGLGNMEPIEIGFIGIGIIGFALLTHGLVNKQEIEASSKSRR